MPLSEHTQTHSLSYFNYVDEPIATLEYFKGLPNIVEKTDITNIMLSYHTPYGLVAENYMVCDPSEYTAFITISHHPLLDSQNSLKHSYEIQIVDIVTAQKKIITDLKETKRLDEFWRYSSQAGRKPFLLRKVL